MIRTRRCYEEDQTIGAACAARLVTMAHFATVDVHRFPLESVTASNRAPAKQLKAKSQQL
jgi:hypothetical protein